MACFCQVAFPHISESTERARFLSAPVDSSLKVAYSKVSSVFGPTFSIKVGHMLQSCRRLSSGTGDVRLNGAR